MAALTANPNAPGGGGGFGWLSWWLSHDSGDGVCGGARVAVTGWVMSWKWWFGDGDGGVRLWHGSSAAAAAVGGGVEMRDEGGVVGSEMVGRGDGGSGWCGRETAGISPETW
ncbi:hypothetical protein Tco_1009249 [Tanacetum coccineum]